ncbi:serine-threonine/tyrosine-protein kinase catalytic domain-containing protein [Tanacetum coccineum]
MAEVVVGLDSILALQEKAKKTSRAAGGMTVFGRKIPTSIFPSNGENSGGHLKSLELFFDTLGNENKVLYKFDSETICIATNNDTNLQNFLPLNLRLKEIIDTSIKGEISSKCLKEFAQLADQCLHSHPKKRPTMAEVVVGLDSILALQEKANKTSRPAGGMTVFGRKIPTSIFPSNGENSGGHLKSLELFFDTLGNENKVLYKFDSETICIATNNFSDRNEILDIHTRTYKGRLSNGQVISIVRPYDDSMNSQFMKEASIVIQLEHGNLVNLLGYCIEGTKVLVYEDAPNGSLGGNLLYGTFLDWNKRYKIILGVARVLVYLHKHAPLEIIHCNVEPINVLLDRSLNPKLSDFRWARAINDTNYIEDDHRCGTYCKCGRSGIMAPEYLRENIVSNKVDVFSFGQLVLETISGGITYGLVSNAYRNLNYQVWRNWLEGTPSNIIDPRINVDSSSITRFIEIGLLCIQEDAADRPTMEQVVDMLLYNSPVSLLIPKVPAWVISEISNDISSDDISSNHGDYDSVAVEELGPR